MLFCVCEINCVDFMEMFSGSNFPVPCVMPSIISSHSGGLDHHHLCALLSPNLTGRLEGKDTLQAQHENV